MCLNGLWRFQPALGPAAGARLGLVVEFVAGWLRQHENMQAAVPPEVARELPPRLQELIGYHVLPAAAGRKQAFLALADTDLTMLFATDARDIATAEGQFTTEPERLMSRAPDAINIVTITRG